MVDSFPIPKARILWVELVRIIPYSCALRLEARRKGAISASGIVASPTRFGFRTGALGFQSDCLWETIQSSRGDNPIVSGKQSNRLWETIQSSLRDNPIVSGRQSNCLGETIQSSRQCWPGQSPALPAHYGRADLRIGQILQLVREAQKACRTSIQCTHPFLFNASILFYSMQAPPVYSMQTSLSIQCKHPLPLNAQPRVHPIDRPDLGGAHYIWQRVHLSNMQLSCPLGIPPDGKISHRVDP